MSTKTKFARKTISILLAVFMILGTAFVGAVNVSAASSTIKVRIANVRKLYSDAKSLLDMVNSFREDNGSDPLKMDKNYLDKARKFSTDANYPKAVEYYDLALDKSPSNHEVLLEKARCLENLGKKHDASQCYFEAVHFSAYSSNEDEVMRAVKYLKKAIELDSNNDDALHELGFALSRLKRYSEAITYYKRVTNKNVDWQMANCYMKSNQYQEAIGLLDNCLKEAPLRGDWLCQKCECLFKVGRMDEAITEFKSFIDALVSDYYYDKAIYMIDDLSKRIGDDDFFKDEKEEYMKNK